MAYGVEQGVYTDALAGQYTITVVVTRRVVAVQTGSSRTTAQMASVCQMTGWPMYVR